MEDPVAQFQAELHKINQKLQEFSLEFQNVQDMKTEMKRLEESLHEALETLVPKVDRLLAREDGGAAAASHTTRHPTDPVSTFASLMEMAESGNSTGLLRLLTAGADPRQRNRNGDTALHVAAAHGHLEATIVLLGSAGCAAVNYKGQRMRTPLHCAAMHGHLSIVDRLLISDADVNVKDADGATPLALAATAGHADVATTLLNLGVSIDDTDKAGLTPLLRAINAKHTEVVKLLLNRGASATKYQSFQKCALLLAAKSGENTIVSELLRRGAKSNEEQMMNAIKEAANAAVVWEFLQEVPEQFFEKLGKNGFVSAAERGREELLGIFLDSGINIDIKSAFGDTALHAAAYNGRLDCVQKLLEREACLAATDNKGSTALHLASQQGHVECVRALLAAGAAVNVKNKAGHTAINVAKSEEVRQLLS